MKKIILASRSPRRKELMKVLGIPFEVIPSSYEESSELRGDPIELVVFLSFQKAQDVASKYEDTLVIGVDTIVVLNDQILGKPSSKGGAREMLSRLSGKKHSVFTAFTIIDTFSRKVTSRVVESQVKFKQLSQKEIDTYIETGEPFDKAGGYGVQGIGSILIEKIDGDYFNVVGLPLVTLADELRKFGIEVKY